VVAWRLASIWLGRVAAEHERGDLQGGHGTAKAGGLGGRHRRIDGSGGRRYRPNVQIPGSQCSTRRDTIEG
jgi:hypothetical protein